MAGKKGSKNALSNRGKKTLRFCDVCDTEQKAISVLKNHKFKLLFTCDCGYRTKLGELVML